MKEWAALELVPEAVVVTSRDGVVLYANTRATDLFELPPDATGSRFRELVDLRDDTGQRCDVCAVRPGDVADRTAERVLRVERHGRVRPVAMTVAIHARRLVLTFRHAGRRERVDAARSDLIATVSHEIRSPLTSVKGFTRTMLAKWDRFSDEQKQHMLLTINDDADRVTRLLSELLDVSRIDAGRVQLSRQLVDIEELVRRVVAKAEQLPDASAVTVTADAALPKLWLAPDKIEQVVTNLVDNAFRYAPGSRVRVSVTSDPSGVLIEVADDGPGIPDDQLMHVFAKFARGRGVRGSGTGLGLYITKGLVEAHGGQVTVRSGVGAGATFRVILPEGQPPTR